MLHGHLVWCRNARSETMRIQSNRCRRLSFPVSFFLANTSAKKIWQGSSSATTVACARQVLHDARLALNVITDPLSRVDEETTAHNEWVRLNGQGEKECRLFRCLGATGLPALANVPKTNISCANKETLFALGVGPSLSYTSGVVFRSRCSLFV